MESNHKEWEMDVLRIASIPSMISKLYNKKHNVIIQPYKCIYSSIMSIANLSVTTICQV